MSREDLNREWLQWVAANLGRDPGLAAIAAAAATDAAQMGAGYNGAVDAARAAWTAAATNAKSEKTTSAKAARTGQGAVLGLGCGGGCAMALGAVIAFLSLSLSLFAVADVCTPGPCQSDPELPLRINIAVTGQIAGFAAGLIAAVGVLVTWRWLRPGAVLLLTSGLVAIAALIAVFIYYPISPASACWQSSWCDAPFVAGGWLLPGALMVWAAAFLAIRRWRRPNASPGATPAHRPSDNPGLDSDNVPHQ